MKKRIFIFTLILETLIVGSIVIRFSNKSVSLDSILLNDVNDNSSFAIMVENEDGEYEKYTGTSWPTNMLYNEELSGCNDSDGNTIDNALTYNSNSYQVSVTSNESFYCYLYFDLIKSLYENILINDNNSKTINEAIEYIKSKGTPNFGAAASQYVDEGLYYAEDDYGDSYYFRGDVEDNYVYFAGFYWRIVRINGDNSVRLIYDGTSAHKSYGNGDYSSNRYTLSTSLYFNTSQNNNAFVGYMYGDEQVLTYGIVFSSTTSVIDMRHYYASSYTFDETTGIYTLSDDATKQNFSEDIIDMYTCTDLSTNCSTMIKYSFYQDNTATGGPLVYYTYLYSSSSTTDEDENIIYAETSTIQGNLLIYDGDFTNPTFVGTTTALIYYVYSFPDYTFSYGANVFYYSGSASSVLTFSDSLVGTYTCFTNQTSCDTMYYVDSINDDGTLNVHVITFTAAGYDDVHANVNDSNIKKAVDSWYVTNILNKTDGTNSYADYLSDTLFCNDRSLYSGTGVGRDITYYSAYDRLYTNSSPTLLCANQNDRFTVDDTEFGNGALTYPIALITADEIVMAGNGSYSYINNADVWTMTPSYMSISVSSGTYNYYVGVFMTRSPSLGTFPVAGWSSYVKVVINIKSSVVVTSGDGTADNPYILSLGSE